MRPHWEAFSKHSVPMNPSDNVHKTVLRLGDTKKPSANTNAGRHQKRNIFVLLHNTSRCFGSQALGRFLMAARVQRRVCAFMPRRQYWAPDLDCIAILQAEMISQIDISDDLDDAGIPSIRCRSRRCPQERFPMIETDQFAGKQQYVALAAVLFSTEPNFVSFIPRVKPIKT